MCILYMMHYWGRGPATSQRPWRELAGFVGELLSLHASSLVWYRDGRLLNDNDEKQNSTFECGVRGSYSESGERSFQPRQENATKPKMSRTLWSWTCSSLNPGLGTFGSIACPRLHRHEVKVGAVQKLLASSSDAAARFRSAHKPGLRPGLRLFRGI